MIKIELISFKIFFGALLQNLFSPSERFFEPLSMAKFGIFESRASSKRINVAEFYVVHWI